MINRRCLTIYPISEEWCMIGYVTHSGKHEFSDGYTYLPEEYIHYRTNTTNQITWSSSNRIVAMDTQCKNKQTKKTQ